MYVWEILIKVTIAALSVIGLYGILHGLLEFLSVPGSIASAVLLSHSVSPEEVDMLLCEARRTPFGGGHRRLLLVLDVRLLEGNMGEEGRLRAEYVAVAEKYDAQICLLEAGVPESAP